MTVRGRKGFVEAYRAFKISVGRKSTTPGCSRSEKKGGSFCVKVDGDRSVATRSRLAWISVKVRVKIHPWTEQCLGLLCLLPRFLTCRCLSRRTQTLPPFCRIPVSPVLVFCCTCYLSIAWHSFPHTHLCCISTDPHGTDEHVEEEAAHDSAMAIDTEISSADDRADRRRQHLLDDSDAPGDSL